MSDRWELRLAIIEALVAEGRYDRALDMIEKEEAALARTAIGKKLAQLGDLRSLAGIVWDPDLSAWYGPTRAAR